MPILKRNKLYFNCVLCITLFLLLFSGCGKNDTSLNQESNNADKSIPAEAMVIETSYGDLYYPEQWKEFLQTEEEQKGEVLVISFRAVIQENTYDLFDVSIGGNEGTIVGQITSKDGTQRAVYIDVADIGEDSRLTEGEQNSLYAMQEDLNYLVDNLK